MNENIKIYFHILDYLKLQVEGFRTSQRGKFNMFFCPNCKNENLTGIIIPASQIARCNACKVVFGDIIQAVRYFEEDKREWKEDDIVKYLGELFKVPVKIKQDINTLVDFYEKNSFDLVPVAPNNKMPIEKDWTKKNHISPEEWKDWLNENLNIGVKTGAISNVTVIDVDTKEIDKDLKEILKKYETCYQETNKGFHFFFKYDKDLPKTRIDSLKIDIENNGGQVVVAPSTINGLQRSMTIKEIIPFPEELKKFLLDKITIPNLKSFSEKLKEDIQTENFNLQIIDEGNRNNFLIHLGGIIRKELNDVQTGFTLSMINRHFCKPPLSQREVDILTRSLAKYTAFDEQELASKILQYMKVVEDASSRDIREAIGEMTAEGKQRVEKAIKFLVREGFLIKKRRNFHIIQKAEWKDTFIEEGKKIDFKMPYFEDYAIFRNGDMIVIGARAGIGKTHVAMNMIKQFNQQGKKPHYISLESGSRFITIALKLGLKEGDFFYCTHFSPEGIELEENTITIIDWLLPNDYAETDKLYKHFAEQLVKKGGILIIFVQLKQNDIFFAENMLSMFPAVVAKFLYEDERGIDSHFHLSKIREPRLKTKSAIIPTRYDFETKELKIVEVEQNLEDRIII